jgi:hypothetical protein
MKAFLTIPLFIIFGFCPTHAFSDDYQQQTQIMQEQLDLQKEEQQDQRSQELFNSIGAAIRRKKEREREEKANEIQAEATAEAQKQQQVDDQNNALKALNEKMASKYDEYVIEIEDINIDRESLGMLPRATLTYQEWQNPKGFVPGDNDVESVTESVDNRIRYSDYVLSFEKLNVKRKRAKLRTKKILSYPDWCNVNSIAVPVPTPTMAPPDLPQGNEPAINPPQDQNSNSTYRDSSGTLHIEH